MAENKFKNTFKKKEEKQARKKLSLNFNFAIFKDRRFHLAFGFFFLFASVYLFIAFLSYLFTGKADHSVVEAVAESGLRESGQEAINWLGLSGAMISHRFIYLWFGLASFFIPPFFFIWGYSIVFAKKIVATSRAFSFALFFMIWVSIFFGYLVYTSGQVTSYGFLSGGIGYELGLWFHSLMGWGTVILLLFSLVIFIIFYFNITSLLGFGKRDEQLIEDDQAYGGILPDENKESLKELSEETAKETELSDEEGLDGWEFKKEDININPERPVKDEGIAFSVEQAEEEVILPDAEEEEPEFEVEQAEEEKLGKKMENYDPTLDLGSYRYPGIDLLDEHDTTKVKVTEDELIQNKDRIIETLSNFKIGISSIKATIGPTVTLYEIVPEAGVKISKIKNLEDDIALSLAALGIRIIAPIPGKGTIGIEVPNKNREMVSMRSVVSTEKFMKSDKELPIILGKTISNEVYITDLAKMPHLLMAGATGQGKSVGLNVILTSLIYKKHPSQLKFVLVDPKKVELTLFNTIERHFLAKLPNTEEAIITDTRKVVNTLNSLCMEMDNRYDLLKDAGCRNLKEYNTKFVNRRLNPEKGHRFLPYIVLVIDELADLMMTAGKEVETPIARLAQLARAIGIHLIIATQRPSVNVITGIIKANFPARLSFRVTSKIDSRTILDAGGAEQLIGMGDMLLNLGSDSIRLQCPFVDTPEVDRVCEFVGSQRGYPDAYMLPEFEGDEEKGVGEVDLADRDPLFDDAARLIVTHQQGSTSLIQRKMKLGYNRAGRLIDQLEAAGIVGAFEGSKAREVLIQDEYALEQLLNSLNDTKF